MNFTAHVRRRPVSEGDVVTVYDDGHHRGLWRLGKIESLVHGADGVVRRVYVRVMSKAGRPKLLRRPLQQIHPLEVRCEPMAEKPSVVDTNEDVEPGDAEDTPLPCVESTTSSPLLRRPTRKARPEIGFSAVSSLTQVTNFSVELSPFNRGRMYWTLLC